MNNCSQTDYRPGKEKGCSAIHGVRSGIVGIDWQAEMDVPGRESSGITG